MKKKTGREFVVYPPIYKENFLITSEELHAIHHKHQERMKYYEKLEKVLGLEKGDLEKRNKDLSDAITEAMIKTFY